MLRISTTEWTDGIRLSLEGELKGAWVMELEAQHEATSQRLGRRTLVIDVENLTGADQAGRYLIKLLERDGAILEYRGGRPAFLGLEGWSTGRMS